MRSGLAVLIGLAVAAPAAAQAPAAPPPIASPSGAAPAAGSEWKAVDPANTWVIETTKGRIIVELHPELAPAHVARIKTLTRQGYYDGALWYRVVDSFMAQGGDKGDKQYRSKLPNLKAEFTFRRTADMPYFSVVATEERGDMGFTGPMPVTLDKVAADGSQTGWVMFCPGVAGFTHYDTPVDSANSQFFLMRQAGGLDKTFTAFGRVLVGQDVVRALKVGEPVVGPDKMTRVRILADIPAAQRPVVEVMDTQSAAFAASVKKIIEDKRGAVTLCDFEVPAQVR